MIIFFFSFSCSIIIIMKFGSAVLRFSTAVIHKQFDQDIPLLYNHCPPIKTILYQKLLLKNISSRPRRKLEMCNPGFHEDKLQFKILLMKQHSSALLHLSFQSEIQCTDKKINASELSSTFFWGIIVLPQWDELNQYGYYWAQKHFYMLRYLSFLPLYYQKKKKKLWIWLEFWVSFQYLRLLISGMSRTKIISIKVLSSSCVCVIMQVCLSTGQSFVCLFVLQALGSLHAS